MNRPTVIFDLGGVLLHIQYRRFLETLGLDQTLDESSLLQTMRHDGRLYERGVISTAEFFQELRGRLGTSHDDQQLHEAWYTILDSEIDGMRDLVGWLARHESLYLLSNTNELHFEYALQTFPVMRMFKDYFLSYRIGWMKPSREIYRHVVYALGRKPEDLFFTDDVRENVEAAKQVGLHGELFTGVDALRRRLIDMGFTG